MICIKSPYIQLGTDWWGGGALADLAVFLEEELESMTGSTTIHASSQIP